MTEEEKNVSETTETEQLKDAACEADENMQPAADEGNTGSEQETAKAATDSKPNSSAKTETSGDGDKKSKFMKKKSKDGRIEVDATELKKAEAAYEELSKKNEAIMDSHRRLMAEFENYKRRSEEQKKTLRADGVGDAVKEFLKVTDNLERALNTAKEQNNEPIANGIQLCIDLFLSSFAKYDLKKIDSDGAEFDPGFHEAMMQQPTEDEELKGKVATTLQTGYMMNGKVLRHSMVAVYA